MAISKQSLANFIERLIEQFHGGELFRYNLDYPKTIAFTIVLKKDSVLVLGKPLNGREDVRDIYPVNEDNDFLLLQINEALRDQCGIGYQVMDNWYETWFLIETKYGLIGAYRASGGKLVMICTSLEKYKSLIESYHKATELCLNRQTIVIDRLQELLSNMK